MPREVKKVLGFDVASEDGITFLWQIGVHKCTWTLNDHHAHAYIQEKLQGGAFMPNLQSAVAWSVGFCDKPIEVAESKRK